ncbi:MAG: hypothetical protein ACTS41_00430 [Candidatus Hodgkinia cicadicola]
MYLTNGYLLISESQTNRRMRRWYYFRLTFGGHLLIIHHTILASHNHFWIKLRKDLTKLFAKWNIGFNEVAMQSRLLTLSPSIGLLWHGEESQT